jgi:hypothetical protein
MVGVRDDASDVLEPIGLRHGLAHRPALLDPVIYLRAR